MRHGAAIPQHACLRQQEGPGANGAYPSGTFAQLTQCILELRIFADCLVHAWPPRDDQGINIESGVNRLRIDRKPRGSLDFFSCECPHAYHVLRGCSLFVGRDQRLRRPRKINGLYTVENKDDNLSRWHFWTAIWHKLPGSVAHNQSQGIRQISGKSTWMNSAENSCRPAVWLVYCWYQLRPDH